MNTKHPIKEPKRLLLDLPVLDNPSFCSRVSPMTGEELEILSDLRNMKEQARVIKSRLAAMKCDWKLWVDNPEAAEIPGSARLHIKRLAELIARWRIRAHDYEEARRRRMIALGHEQP
jgi:hypothetical protein